MHAADRVRVAAADDGVRFAVPNAHGAVCRAAGNGEHVVRVDGDGQRPDNVLVAVEDVDEIARFRVPHAHLAVGRARNNVAADDADGADGRPVARQRQRTRRAPDVHERLGPGDDGARLRLHVERPAVAVRLDGRHADAALCPAAQLVELVDVALAPARSVGDDGRRKLGRRLQPLLCPVAPKQLFPQHLGMRHLPPAAADERRREQVARFELPKDEQQRRRIVRRCLQVAPAGLLERVDRAVKEGERIRRVQRARCRLAHTRDDLEQRLGPRKHPRICFHTYISIVSSCSSTRLWSPSPGPWSRRMALPRRSSAASGLNQFPCQTGKMRL